MNFRIFKEMSAAEDGLRWELISGGRVVITSDEFFPTEDEARAAISDFKKTASGVKFAKVKT